MSSFKFLINKLKRSEWTIPLSNLFYLFAWRGTFYPVESLLITLDFHCPVGKNPSEFWSMLRVNHYRVEERKGFWIHLHHLLFALTPLTPSPQGKIVRCLRSPTTLLSECLSCSVMFLSVFWFVYLNMKPLPQNLLKCWIILPLCDYKLVRYKLTPLYVRCARTRL